MMDTQKSLEIIAHRGIHSHMTENTVDAILAALQLGSKSVEFDVVFTKDQVAVINHDYIIHPKDFLGLGTKRDLRTMSYKEINLLKHKKDSTKIPSLTELLAAISALKDNSFTLHLEMKSLRSKPATRVKFVETVIKELHNYSLFESTILRSFDWQTVAIAKQQARDLRRALLINALHWAYRTRSFQKIYDQYQPVMIAPKYTIASKQMIAKWKTLGVKVNPYTVNDIETAKQLIAWGVDGITTDTPIEMLTAFAK